MARAMAQAFPVRQSVVVPMEVVSLTLVLGTSYLQTQFTRGAPVRKAICLLVGTPSVAPAKAVLTVGEGLIATL